MSESKPRNAIFKGMVKKGAYEGVWKAGEIGKKPGEGWALLKSDSVSSSFYTKVEQEVSEIVLENEEGMGLSF